MKNKTLRTNSMKLKTVIAASLAISVLFAFTGCGNSSSTDNTNTKQESSSTTETGSADELNEKRNDLYQQENQLFVDHKDAWDKAFGLMNKNTDGDAMNENYAKTSRQSAELKKKLPSLRKRLLHPIPLTALPPNQTNPQLYSKVSKEKIWMETM